MSRGKLVVGENTLLDDVETAIHVAGSSPLARLGSGFLAAEACLTPVLLGLSVGLAGDIANAGLAPPVI